MAYLLCDMFYRKSNTWEYYKGIITKYIQLSKYACGGYRLCQGDNPISDDDEDPVKIFKVFNLETKQFLELDFNQFYQLLRKEDFIGQKISWNGFVEVKCISVNGYYFSTMLDIVKYIPPIKGIKFVLNHTELDNLPVIFTPNTNEPPLWYPIVVYKADFGNVYGEDKDVFIGDYIAHLFKNCPSSILPYLLKVEGNELTMWGISDVTRPGVSQSGEIILKINDVAKFNKLAAKIKLSGGR